MQVEVSREQGEPRKVVEIAKRMATDARLEAKSQQDRFLGFDEVWCLFDRDAHERFDAAVDMARSNKFELAVSNPCFELWLLLHFRESPGQRHRHSVQEMLGQHIPGYDKKLDFDDVAASVPVAVDRAKRLDQDAKRMGEAGRNPTTGVYRLVESIARRDAKR